MDVCFHPTRPLVAAGLITGVVETFEFTAAAATAVTSRDVHAESCRAVRFLLDGSGLVSAGVDCSLVVSDAETGARVARVKDAHDAAINRLAMLSETLMATGAWATLRGGDRATAAARLLRPADALPRAPPPQATTTATCGFGTRARGRA